MPELLLTGRRLSLPRQGALVDLGHGRPECAHPHRLAKIASSMQPPRPFRLRDERRESLIDPEACFVAKRRRSR